MQGPRNGRGGESEDVNVTPDGLEPLLLSHSKSLLLVNDEEAQIPEDHIGLEKPVGSNHDVNCPCSQTDQHLLLLTHCTESGEHFDLHGERPETASEGSMVLLRKHRGRDQHCHLPAVHHRLESGPQGHLGLPVAHVPSDQSVHRAGLLHVNLDLLQHSTLIGSLKVGERALQLCLPRRIR